MRLRGQMKGGFFPAPIPAVEHVLKYLVPPPEGKFYILDPCCGEGVALHAFAEGLGINHKWVFGCELEPNRFNLASALLPESTIIGPANYLSCEITQHCLSFAWVNPPFDDEIGGGNRVEHDFLKKTTAALTTGGIMALACPEKQLDNDSIKRHFKTWYTDISVIKYPEEHRKFNEIVILGRKLAEDEQDYSVYASDWKINKSMKYAIPVGFRPYTFRKVELTQEELEDAVSRSPLTKLIQATDELVLARPPMSLGNGHIALLLASGHLDGIVYPEDEPPHVVRGTAKKVEYVADVKIETDGDKSSTTIIKAERIVLVVRTLDSTGALKTLSDNEPESQEEGDESDE